MVLIWLINIIININNINIINIIHNINNMNNIIDIIILNVEVEVEHVSSYGGLDHLHRDHGLGPVCQAVGCLLRGSLGGAPVCPEYLYQLLGPSTFCIAQSFF